MACIEARILKPQQTASWAMVNRFAGDLPATALPPHLPERLFALDPEPFDSV
jgi:hypothetical protein